MNLRVSSMALFAMLATAAWAQIKLEVNLKDGDSISGEKRVVVLATSKNESNSSESEHQSKYLFHLYDTS